MHSYCFVAAAGRVTLLDALTPLGVVEVVVPKEIDDNGEPVDLPDLAYRRVRRAGAGFRSVYPIEIAEGDGSVLNTFQVVTPVRDGARARLFFDTPLSDETLLGLAAEGLSIEDSAGWPPLVDGASFEIVAIPSEGDEPEEDVEEPGAPEGDPEPADEPEEGA